MRVSWSCSAPLPPSSFSSVSEWALSPRQLKTISVSPIFTPLTPPLPPTKVTFVFKVNNGHTRQIKFLLLYARHINNGQTCHFSSSPVRVEMGGVRGFGLEVDQRLMNEEGVERHIFGHSRETGEI